MDEQTESGALSKEDFELEFQNTPVVEVGSSKELRDVLEDLCIQLQSQDWKNKVTNLQKIRSVLKCDKFSGDKSLHTKVFLIGFELIHCIADDRSKVAREACITVAFISNEMKNKMQNVIELCLESLLSLVPKAANIISSCGKIALKIIVYNTQSVPILKFFLNSGTTSKSKSVRQFSIEIVKLICENWPQKLLDNFSDKISETLKIGINDADETARSNSREAFCWFNMKFPQAGDKLLQSLDKSKQKALQKEFSTFTVKYTYENFKVPGPRQTNITAATLLAQNANSAATSRINSSKSDNMSINYTELTKMTDTNGSFIPRTDSHIRSNSQCNKNVRISRTDSHIRSNSQCNKNINVDMNSKKLSTNFQSPITYSNNSNYKSNISRPQPLSQSNFTSPHRSFRSNENSHLLKANAYVENDENISHCELRGASTNTERKKDDPMFLKEKTQKNEMTKNKILVEKDLNTGNFNLEQSNEPNSPIDIHIRLTPMKDAKGQLVWYHQIASSSVKKIEEEKRLQNERGESTNTERKKDDPMFLKEKTQKNEMTKNKILVEKDLNTGNFNLEQSNEPNSPIDIHIRLTHTKDAKGQLVWYHQIASSSVKKIEEKRLQNERGESQSTELKKYDPMLEQEADPTVYLKKSQLDNIIRRIEILEMIEESRRIPAKTPFSGGSAPSSRTTARATIINTPNRSTRPQGTPIAESTPRRWK